MKNITKNGEFKKIIFEGYDFEKVQSMIDEYLKKSEKAKQCVFGEEDIAVFSAYVHSQLESGMCNPLILWELMLQSVSRTYDNEIKEEDGEPRINLRIPPRYKK